MIMTGLKFVDGFKLAMNEFGFIVIAWDPSKGEFKFGQEPETIWNCGPAPIPCRIVGYSNRDEWIRQNRFLVANGADFTQFPHALSPPDEST